MHKQWGKGGWTSTWSKLLMFGRVFPFLSSRFGNDKQTSIGSSRVHAPDTSCAQISINIPERAREERKSLWVFLAPTFIHTDLCTHTSGSFTLLHSYVLLFFHCCRLRRMHSSLCIYVAIHDYCFCLSVFLHRQKRNEIHMKQLTQHLIAPMQHCEYVTPYSGLVTCWYGSNGLESKQSKVSWETK